MAMDDSVYERDSDGNSSSSNSEIVSSSIYLGGTNEAYVGFKGYRSSVVFMQKHMSKGGKVNKLDSWLFCGVLIDWRL